MKAIREEKGQTLVLTALCMSAMIGFMALALDVGVLFHARRCLQTAADAAAVAGAMDYLYNQSATSAETAACTAASNNGVSGNCTTGLCTSGSGNQICINLPPQSGPNTGTSGTFVEAIVRVPTQTFFSKSLPVGARAVAALPTNGSACIWVMAPTGNAFDVQGSYDIESPDCGIYVNSNTSDAMNVKGNGGTVNAAFIDVVGNSQLQHQTSPTPATMNSGVRQTPWGSGLSGPNYNATSNNPCQVSNTVTGATINATTTIPAALNGVVCFSGGNTNNPPAISGTVSLPGASAGVVYVFENGVEIKTGATVTVGNPVSYSTSTNTFATPVSGAMLDLGGGKLMQDSNSLLNVYAPDTGTYNGIAIFQPPTNTNQLTVQFGSNNETLDGYIYAPGAEVYLHDSGGGVTATGLVSNQLMDKTGQFTVAHSYDKANPTTTLNRVIVLVE